MLDPWQSRRPPRRPCSMMRPYSQAFSTSSDLPELGNNSGCPWRRAFFGSGAYDQAGPERRDGPRPVGKSPPRACTTPTTSGRFTKRMARLSGLGSKSLRTVAFRRSYTPTSFTAIVDPGDRVLDAGRGPGRFSIALAELGATVTALDLSERQLQMAKDKIGEAGLQERVDGFVTADITDLSGLPNGCFDVLLCYGGALSYVCEYRKKAAAELVRVVRPKGILLISVMSRFGATADIVRRPSMAGPEGSGGLACMARCPRWRPPGVSLHKSEHARPADASVLKRRIAAVATPVRGIGGSRQQRHSL